MALDLEPENQDAYKLFEQINQSDNNLNINFNIGSSRDYKDHKSVINQRRGSSKQMSTLRLNNQTSKESGDKKNSSFNSINHDNSKFLKPKY
ncbi:hypothetical protein IMG5_181190 [Ichthyophthirius multifiliis]|uniref:Uncharacterized protein n=1 Tax=Ichthyophthirius multifiliis TaxID=5932 RepID=G0R2X9_ICHMU|nr:hypothetical protein IMG5_181190 [Ichthyophthirius multifiliis]EGR28190.1 hypothetical protein IMG5_181190 [Ichthyophthirius multifiliis]|eukprot:XP_004027535.1 hypothetical protein IMG5_181190 [Ichthyophthirius multifiliis]